MKNMGWIPQSAYKKLEQVVDWTLKNDRWLSI
jgi:dTDP-glucose 4,6-dehydratase